MNQEYYDAVTKMEEMNVERAKAAKASKKSSKTIKTEFRQQNRFISQQMKLLQDLMKIEQQRDLIKSDKAIDAEFEKQIKNIEDNKTFEHFVRKVSLLFFCELGLLHHKLASFSRRLVYLSQRLPQRRASEVRICL